MFELEISGIQRRSGGFVLGAIQLFQVGMLQCLLHGAPFIGIEQESFAQEIECTWRRVRKQLLQGNRFCKLQRLDEASALVVQCFVQIFLSRSSKHMDDECQLMARIVSRKERLPSEHLRENAPDRPDINCHGVVAPRTQHFWRTIPARAHVFRHGKLVLTLLDPCKSKVANFQVAVRVDQQISRLQVPMDDLCRMDVLQAAHDLVQEELAVVISQQLRTSEDRRKVRLHQLRDDVDILKSAHHARQKNMPHVDEVFMSQVA
mmetsp:Transcript_54149/g.144737  ORF Transcript_54149/g.144737 Transcript_54149/m.144737 type:complete len:262 (-) Transcript_54149:276-1061(-)